MIFAWWMSLPPCPVPADAPPTEFSAERAIAHIREMAREPHPAGSVANDRVCAYIQEQLTSLGIEFELVSQYKQTGERSVDNHRAVLGRIRGTSPGKAMAMDAHFDSVPYGPGATDDLSGVAAMLETARALKAGPPLKNDIIFVFADQEEFNGGGAKAFVEHPWFQGVGMMLGLETRGNKGPALMFETNPNNGWVVREMARANVNPRATSIMFDIYDRLPFGSDFGRYKNRVPGLNVAYVDGLYSYHTRLDNPDNASLASIQHHGAYTLGLARHFGSIPLENGYAPNATYFNTLGGHMVVYSQAWNWPLAGVVVALMIGVLVFGLSRRHLSLGGVLLGTLVVPVAAILSALAVAGPIWYVYQKLHEAALYLNNVYQVSFLMISFAILLAVTTLVRRFVRGRDILAGSLFWWALAIPPMQHYAPGGTYTATWPLFFGSLSLLALCLTGEEEKPSALGLVIATIAAVPALMMIFPALIMASYTITVLGGFLVNMLFVLLLGFMTPQIHAVTGKSRWTVPAVIAACGIVLAAGAYIANQPSAMCPRLNCISYGMDFDNNQAYWLSADRELDAWTVQFFPNGTERGTIREFIPRDDREYWKAPAPSAPFPKPILEVRGDRIENGQRILDLRLDSPRDAQRTRLQVTSAAEVYGASILGGELKGDKKHWRAKFDILPREGANMRLVVQPGVPLIININEQSYGVPVFPGYAPRPDWAAAEPNRTLDHRRPLRSEHTFSTCTIDLGK